MQRLKDSVPWETLVCDRLRVSASGSVVLRPFALPSLPLIHERPGRFWAVVVITMILAATSGFLWFTTPGELGSTPRGGDREMHLALRYLVPGFCLLTWCGFLFGWQQFRVEADGVEFRAILSARRYPWSELASVQVAIESCLEQALVMTPRKGQPLRLELQEKTLLFRDAILEAASRAGFDLESKPGG